jgi:hypothetical protein
MNAYLPGRKPAGIPSLSVSPAAQRQALPAFGELRAASPGSTAAVAGGPQIEAVKEGDRVVRLVVTCSCGEKIEVECLYPAGG